MGHPPHAVPISRDPEGGSRWDVSSREGVRAGTMSPVRRTPSRAVGRERRVGSHHFTQEIYPGFLASAPYNFPFCRTNGNDCGLSGTEHRHPTMTAPLREPRDPELSTAQAAKRLPSRRPTGSLEYESPTNPSPLRPSFPRSRPRGSRSSAAVVGSRYVKCDETGGTKNDRAVFNKNVGQRHPLCLSLPRTESRHS